VADDDPLTVRTFGVPRERLFAGWTEPDLLARWGPDGFAVRRDSVTVELREGGRYEFCMVQEADGAEFWLRYEVVRLVVPELLVLDLEPSAEDGHPAPVRTTVRFEPVPGGTRLTIRRPYPPARRAFARATWDAALDSLAALLTPAP
jgi:uncharacterized protein YndB with AHSA1/START domain